MKARIVIHTPEPRGGAALYISALGSALAQRGEDVAVLCPDNFVHAGAIRDSGVRMVFCGNRSTAPACLLRRLLRNARFAASIYLTQLRFLRAGDVIHFQCSLYFPAGLVPFLIAKLQGVRIVYTAHDPLPHKWLLPGRFRSIERKCLEWAYRLSDRIVVHNETGRDLLVREFQLDPARIAVILHGAATLSAGEVTQHQSEVLQLLMFGSIREDKCLDLAIEAVQRINAGGIRVRLIIAGTVANARESCYWDACRRTIARSSGGIEVHEGFVADEDIPVLLARSHALLLPYRNFPSESGVASLALGRGRAIIATDTGGFAELLRAADLGIAIAEPTVSAVELAIRLALQLGPGELSAKGIRGLEFLRSTRSWDQVARQTAMTYRQLGDPGLPASQPQMRMNQ